MITLRYAAFLLATITLGCLACIPNSPATVILAGFFLICFGVVAWTCREPRRTDAHDRTTP